MRILYSKLFSATLIIFSILPGVLFAQTDDEAYVNKVFISAKWQVNHLSNNFIKGTSGWGISLDANYYITEKFSTGIFAGWHTNNEYTDNETYIYENQTVNTSMQRSVYQVPLGILGRYDIADNKTVSPYVQLKIGANYSKQSVYLPIAELNNKNWGIYISPEVGINVYLVKSIKLVLQASTYYAYASNTFNFMNAHKVTGLSNLGLRIGLSVPI